MNPCTQANPAVALLIQQVRKLIFAQPGLLDDAFDDRSWEIEGLVVRYRHPSGVSGMFELNV